MEKFEPQETGSDSTKRTLSEERVLHGWAGGTEYEQIPNKSFEQGDVDRLHALFGEACYGGLTFHGPACLTRPS